MINSIEFIPPNNLVQDILDVYKKSEDFLSLGPISTASIKMVLEDLEYSKQHGYSYYCIRYGEKIVGVCDYLEYGFEGDNGNGYINLIIICKENRNHGIGREVLDKIEIGIRKHKCQRIIAFVQTNNSNAIEFWIKSGFSICSDKIRNEDKTIVYRIEKMLKL
jgi:ribosomal protein S18 acetylase RimI-like enzyme